MQDFPEGGAKYQRGCASLFFVKKCMEVKEFGPVGASLALPYGSPDTVHPWPVHCECAMKRNKRCIFNYLHIRSGGSRIFQMGGRCFVTNGGGAHPVFR